MKSINIVAVASLLALAYATPVEKRELVVHTVIEEVTETVDTTTTIWVKPTAGAHANYQLPKHQHHHHSHQSKPVTTPSSTSAPYVAPVPTTPSSTSTSASTSSSTSVYVPPYTPPVVPTTSVSIPPVVPETTPVPVVPVPVVPETTPVPVVPVPEPTTQAPVPVPSTPSTSPTESGGACGEIGGACSGDITYYEAGLGACGWTNDGSSDDVFALAHGKFHYSKERIGRVGHVLTWIRYDGRTIQRQPLLWPYGNYQGAWQANCHRQTSRQVHGLCKSPWSTVNLG